MQPSLHQQIHLEKQQLQLFWQRQIQEVEQTTDFRQHQLPLARIKKIMKSDEEVKMISAEAPVLFAKACELFILELTLRSWMHTEENKRRTLQRNDIAGAISRGDIFDFLVDIVPREEMKEEEFNGNWPMLGAPECTTSGQFFYPNMAAQPVNHAEILQMAPAKSALDPNEQILYQMP